MHGAVTQYSPGPESDRRARPARAGPASASDGHRDLSVSESRSVGGLALIIRPTRMAVAVTVTVVGPGRGRPGPAGPGGRGPAASLRVYTRVRLGNRVPGGLGRRLSGARHCGGAFVISHRMYCSRIARDLGLEVVQA